MNTPRLNSSDARQIEAAIGWMQLDRGNFAEARAELQRVCRRGRRHPLFLRILWYTYYRTHQRALTLHIARRRLKIAPHEPESWIDYAQSLHGIRRTAKAVRVARRGMKHFPDSEVMAYNLACYLCLLGRTGEARSWIWHSVRCSICNHNAHERHSKILSDPELQPLWPEFGDFAGVVLTALAAQPAGKSPRSAMPRGRGNSDLCGRDSRR
jgi:hypothetical protein